MKIKNEFQMDENEKVKNIFTFLCILFGEDERCFEKIMDFSPKYLIEKFERYILSPIPESNWGMHPSLRTNVFDVYCKKYNLPNSLE